MAIAHPSLVSVLLQTNSKRLSFSRHVILAAVSVVLLFLFGHAGFFPWVAEQQTTIHHGARFKEERALENQEWLLLNKSKTLIPSIAIRELGGDPNTPSWSARVTTGNSKLDKSFLSHPALAFIQNLYHEYTFKDFIANQKRWLVIWCLMQNKNTPQVTYSQSDLGTYGWIYGDTSPDHTNIYRAHVTPFLDDAGLNNDGTTQDSMSYAAVNDWNLDGKKQEASLGVYRNIVNGPSGWIIAGDNVSPREQMPDVVLPPLSKWSDIVSIQWSMYAVPRGATDLKYIMRAGVSNANTRAMIQQAFKTVSLTTVPLYPGVDFQWTDDSTDAQITAFKGLLGTYHAAGPGYMLAQHRAQFGTKMITKIRVWAETTAWNVNTGTIDNLVPNMVLFVSDVPKEEA